MKKIVMVLVALTFVLSANAQFEEGKWYGNASLSSLNLSYNDCNKLAVNGTAKVGYCLADNLMVLASVGTDADKHHTNLSAGVGGRYYIIQNGIYLGANLQVKQVENGVKHNDVMPGVEVGYAFFINHYVTIEPSIYYDQSLKSHKDYSTIGFRIGIGVYM